MFPERPQSQYPHVQPTYAEIVSQSRQLSRPNQYQPNNVTRPLYQRQQFTGIHNSQTINHQYQYQPNNVITPLYQQQRQQYQPQQQYQQQQQQFIHNSQAINHQHQYQYQQSNDVFSQMAYKFYQEQQLITSALLIQNQQQVQQQFHQYPQQSSYSQHYNTTNTQHTQNYPQNYQFNPFNYYNEYNPDFQCSSLSPSQSKYNKYSAFEQTQNQNQPQNNNNNNNNPYSLQFNATPTEPLDEGTFTTENDAHSSIVYHTPKRKSRKKKIKNTPSNWTKYYYDLPSTPSSVDDSHDTDDNFHNYYMHDDAKSDEKTELTDITETDEYHQDGDDYDDCNDDSASLISWMNKINNITQDTAQFQHGTYEYNKSITSYNTLTGGKCYSIEQDSKLKSSQSHTSSFFCCYLNHIILRRKYNIFYLNAAGIYENIFSYLDGKSILNGIMLTCKKLYYFKFMDESRIWHMLLRRDFAKLYVNKFAFIRIPYIDTYASFDSTILRRRNEKKLYFNKVKRDKFWSLLFNLRDIDLDRMDNAEIECLWRDIKWIDFLFGKNNDYGFGAYKELIKLRYDRYIISFGKDELPNNELIDYFCNAMRKRMPSGMAIIYLSPWISKKRLVQWTRRQILWLNEYKQCWALSESNKYFYAEMKKIPKLIKLVGKIQFQNGKSFKPDPEWLPFLQTFDPTVSKYNEIKDGWFQKQFMLNEMENRLKNIRTLIEIVRE